MRNLDNGAPSQQGYFGYYGLLSWWNTEFTVEEKNKAYEKYKPYGGESALINSPMLRSTATVVNFLTGFQSWFARPADMEISRKILIKAESLVSENTAALDEHFLYQALIVHYYKLRKTDPTAYQLAKRYCQKQIQMSNLAAKAFLADLLPQLPRHWGYEQLSIILQKEGQLKEALALCKQGKAQGWSSDFGSRILRLEKNLGKIESK
jgi:hypothetical protein